MTEDSSISPRNKEVSGDEYKREVADHGILSNQDLLWMVSDSLQELWPGMFSGKTQPPNDCVEFQPPGQKTPHESPILSGRLVDFQIYLEDCFGEKSGQGILTRVGRTTFFSYLSTHGELFGWFGLDFKLLSTRKRLKNGLETLAQNLYPRHDNPITIASTEKSWIWRDENCPWCIERITPGNSCSFTSGFLQEFTYWAGAGKTYLVREVECIAAGGQACVYQVEKKPLD